MSILAKLRWTRIGVVVTIFHPVAENAVVISSHDFPKDVPESTESPMDEGGQGMSVTRFACSLDIELQAESAPSSNSKPSADFHAFRP